MEALRLINNVKQGNRLSVWRNMRFWVNFSKIWKETFIVLLKEFVVPTVLNGYVPQCSIIGLWT